MTQVELRHGAATDVGRVREVNEDALLAAPPVFVVADGMGGHAHGDVASRIVVEEFARLADAGYDPERGTQAVERTFAECQRRILAYASSHRGRLRGRRSVPGTTAVVALLVEDEAGVAWLLANLGDSRIYRVSARRLEQVSVDHSVVQELVDAGRIAPEQAVDHPERNVITRALGGPGHDRADFFLLPIPTVERLLLCSDGVSNLLTHDQIEAVLLAAPDPSTAAERLVAAALEAGGTDNATAVVIDVVGWVADTSDAAAAGREPEQEAGP